MKYIKGDFFQVPNKRALSGLKPRAVTVFVALCSYADKEGQCFPALTTLARRCGVGRSTVVTALEELESSGFITKAGKKGLANRYQIMLVDTSPISEPVLELNGGSPISERVPVPVLDGNNIHKQKPLNDNLSVEKIKDTVNPVLDIEFFHRVFPSDFVGNKNAYAIPAIRELVKANLMVYSHDEIVRLLASYEPRMSEQYAPAPGKNVYAFFADNKLSAIRRFVDKLGAGQVRGYKTAYGKPLSEKDQATVDAVKRSIKGRG